MICEAPLTGLTRVEMWRALMTRGPCPSIRWEEAATNRRLGDLLARTASGELPARVHTVVPLDQAADAQPAMAKGGVRGRYVLQP
jgi:NADPH:quinone reductase-like Zn-dependent oxidoreductase